MTYKRVKLADHKSANCSVRLYDDGSMVLQSYNTDVILFHKPTGYLYCSGTFSVTTRKHITWFLHQYFPNHSISYTDMKKCVDNRMKYHVGPGCGWFFTSLTEKESELLHAHYGCALWPNLFN